MAEAAPAAVPEVAIGLELYPSCLVYSRSEAGQAGQAGEAKPKEQARWGYSVQQFALAPPNATNAGLKTPAEQEQLESLLVHQLLAAEFNASTSKWIKYQPLFAAVAERLYQRGALRAVLQRAAQALAVEPHGLSRIHLTCAPPVQALIEMYVVRVQRAPYRARERLPLSLQAVHLYWYRDEYGSAQASGARFDRRYEFPQDVQEVERACIHQAITDSSSDWRLAHFEVTLGKKQFQLAQADVHAIMSDNFAQLEGPLQGAVAWALQEMLEPYCTGPVRRAWCSPRFQLRSLDEASFSFVIYYGEAPDAASPDTREHTFPYVGFALSAPGQPGCQFGTPEERRACAGFLVGLVVMYGRLPADEQPAHYGRFAEAVAQCNDCTALLV